MAILASIIVAVFIVPNSIRSRNVVEAAGGFPGAPLASNDIVLYASEAMLKLGNWVVTADPSAAGGARLWNPDNGAPKITTPAASPANYFEASFGAQAGTAYRLWIRGRAENDSPYNDSVFVQFSGSVDGSGASAYRIGTASATTINLEDDLGVGLSGWGWQDNGWGAGVMGAPIYFAATGSQKLRVQVREDGLSIDQIVLSPATYFNSAPGALKNDNTILPKQSGIAQAPSVTGVSPAAGDSAGGTFVTINGTNFLPGARVVFGGSPATSVNVASSTSLSAVTPAHAAGTVSLTVTNSDGQSGALPNAFTYVVAVPMPHFSHVFAVVLENHGYSTVIGSSSMPYLNSLATKFGLAIGYYANTHPSIGNYFMMTAGQIITNDDKFAGTVTADNIVRQLTIAGKTWRAYAESLPSTGYIGGDVYPYSKHHNPFAYFSDVTGSIGQANNIVPFTQLAADLSSNQLSDYSFIIPNQLHNAHDCPAGMPGCTDSDKLAAADSWLNANIQPLITNPVFQKDSLLILTFDEAESADTASGGGHVATIVISPKAKPRYASTTFYQHQNMLTSMAEAVGLTAIPGAAANALSLAEFIETLAPTISSISPNSGPTTGGTTITISGAHFSSAVKITIGGVAATNINVTGPGTVIATTPPQAAGVADVTLTNADGQSVVVPGGFTYAAGTTRPTTIVMYASEAAVRMGNWNPVSDTSAAGAARLWNPDAGVPKITGPSANPGHYFEMTFNAQAGTPYRLWIRGKAENDYWGNDSVFAQFSDSVDNGAAVYRIGSTAATTINLEDCSGCGLSGWGWQDNGWGVGVLGPLIYFASTGTHTIRIQVREDGLSIDQIVLSPDTYLNTSPGALKNDNSILTKTQ
jgi:acid phosphatase